MPNGGRRGQRDNRLVAGDDGDSVIAMVRLLSTAAALSLAVLATPAAAEWREASTDHFLIYADSGEAWLRGFAERLERGSAAIRVLRPQTDPEGERSNRVVVYAVAGMAVVQDLCGKCGSVAGFYVPRVGHSVIYTPRSSMGRGEMDLTSDIVLFHEYAHHIMFSNTVQAYPRWYSEGFAEVFSTIRITDDKSVEIGRPAKHRAYNLLNSGLKIERLLDPPAKMTAVDQDVFYGRAWMLSHMLMFDSARSGQIERYLQLLNTGKPSIVAAREAFGDLGALQKSLDSYVRKPIRFARMPAAMVRSGATSLRVLTPGEAAMMPVRLRSDRGVNTVSAALLVPDARRRAAPFAADPGAQVALAEAEYDAGNDLQAEAAADRALAANPRDPRAMLYKGRVLVRRAIAARADAATWRAARAWFVKANGIDPNAAEPLLLYYRSFAQAGAKPTANAAAALARAFALSPQDPGLRMTAVFQLLSDGKVAEARRALLPLAYDPHIPADRNFAARIVAMIDAGRATPEILGTTPAADENGGDR